MVFKHFRVHVVLRVLLITLFLLLSFYLALELGLYYTAILAFFIACFVFIMLIRYVELANREVSQFLMAIKFHDFSISFPESGSGKNLGKLRKSFNSIIKEFQRIKAEKEVNHQFLQAVVGSIPIGIICTGEGGKIFIFNEAASNLVQVKHLSNFSQLSKVSPALFDGISNMKPYKPFLYKSEKDGLKLQIKQIRFRLNGGEYRLITLQNINSELDFGEIESWQKLINVLTHEIMNSVTPISSLSGTLETMIFNEKGEAMPITALDEEAVSDIGQGIRAIRNRSKGLLAFVESYRSFTRVPKPIFEKVKVELLFERAKALMHRQLQEKNIKLLIEKPNPGLELFADSEQIEQVLINLVLNAMDAVRDVENPEIRLTAYKENEAVQIKVKDNGPGISKENAEKIFIPFYTTKESGSGIGLSLSRQIMAMHHGRISVVSSPSGGAEFVLKF